MSRKKSKYKYIKSNCKLFKLKVSKSNKIVRRMEDVSKLTLLSDL